MEFGKVDRYTKQLILSMIPKWVGLGLLILIMIYYVKGVM